MAGSSGPGRLASVTRRRVAHTGRIALSPLHCVHGAGVLEYAVRPGQRGLAFGAAPKVTRLAPHGSVRRHVAVESPRALAAAAAAAGADLAVAAVEGLGRGV